MRRLFFIILLSHLCLLAGGCGFAEKAKGYFKGDADNAEPPTPLVEFTPSIDVIQLWRRNTGAGADEQYLKLKPAIAGQRLFVVDSQGRLQAMDASNGRVAWSTRAKATASIDGEAGWLRGKKMRVTGGVGYGENTVLIGAEEGDVIAFDAGNGQELWRAVVSSEVLSAPRQAGGVVVVRTLDGKVFGLDGESGRRLWIYDRSVPALTLRGTGAPLIDGDTVVAGFDGGKLAALELATGRLLWESSIATARGASELERMVDIDSEPVALDGVIYVATFQGFIAAVQLDSGRILWSRDVPSHTGFSVDANNAYITDDDSRLWALDRFSGATIWQKEDLYGRAASAPGSVGDYIVVGDYDGYLHWVDKRNGRFAARQRLCDEPIIVRPVIVGRVAYAYCSDGRLGAYTYR